MSIISPSNHNRNTSLVISNSRYNLHLWTLTKSSMRTLLLYLFSADRRLEMAEEYFFAIATKRCITINWRRCDLQDVFFVFFFHSYSLWERFSFLYITIITIYYYLFMIKSTTRRINFAMPKASSISLSFSLTLCLSVSFPHHCHYHLNLHIKHRMQANLTFVVCRVSVCLKQQQPKNKIRRTE